MSRVIEEHLPAVEIAYTERGPGYHLCGGVKKEQPGQRFILERVQTPFGCNRDQNAYCPVVTEANVHDSQAAMPVKFMITSLPADGSLCSVRISAAALWVNHESIWGRGMGRMKGGCYELQRKHFVPDVPALHTRFA